MWNGEGIYYFLLNHGKKCFCKFSLVSSNYFKFTCEDACGFQASNFGISDFIIAQLVFNIWWWLFLCTGSSTVSQHSMFNWFSGFLYIEHPCHVLDILQCLCFVTYQLVTLFVIQILEILSNLIHANHEEPHQLGFISLWLINIYAKVFFTVRVCLLAAIHVVFMSYWFTSYWHRPAFLLMKF